jgi:multidrug efflux pump subunit AcrA (membrane-fusion protein)
MLIILGLNLGAHAATPPSIPPASVFIENVKARPLFSVVTFPARVESRVNAVVRAEADGAVTAILKPLGHRVRAGEPVAVIKHTDPVYEYAPMNVLASVSGVVNEVQVTPGSLVQKGDAIVTVTDPNRLRVMIEVAAQDLPSMKAGQVGELYVAGRSQPFHAQIKGVSPSIDPMLGTATCELAVIPSEAPQLIGGMVGKVQFNINNHQGIMLPESAVVYKGDGTFVRTLIDGHAKRVAVKLGERTQGMVEVLSGLKDGDQVIARTSRFIADGEAVKVETEHE